ncbi:hypothetical protein D3C84_673440 [compost metagenome]
MRTVAGQLEVFLLAASTVGVAFDAHDALGVELQELHDLQHHAVGRAFQLRFTGIEQHIAQGHHQAAISLRRRQRHDLLFEPFALLLHAEQLGFAQGQLQALTLQFELRRALFVEHLIGVLPSDLAVALAQIGVLQHVRTTAPVSGQAVGPSQGLTGTNHILGRDTQHIGIFLDLLEVGTCLLQRRLAVLAGATIEAGATGQDQTTEHFGPEIHWASPNCLRRRAMRVLRTFNCSSLLRVRTRASARRASSSACSARIRAFL